MEKKGNYCANCKKPRGNCICNMEYLDKDFQEGTNERLWDILGDEPPSTDLMEEAREEAERYTKIVSINGYYEHTLEVAFMQGAKFIINKLNELQKK